MRNDHRVQFWTFYAASTGEDKAFEIMSVNSLTDL